MDDKPLVILPYGRTAADQDKLDGKRARGKLGCLIVLIQMAIVAGFLALCWLVGKLS